MVDQTTGNQSRAATILVESKICDGSVEHEFWHTGVANLTVVSSRLQVAYGIRMKWLCRPNRMVMRANEEVTKERVASMIERVG